MRKVSRVVAVVGAALILGLLAVGTVIVAGPPPGPSPKPPKPEPPPTITPQQIIDGVNQLIPHVAIPIPPPPPEPLDIELSIVNRLPSIGAARSMDDGSYLLAFPREGVRLFAARSYDDGPIFGQQAGGTRLGAIELERDYKLGSGPLKQGYYHIAAIYDPNNEIDAKIDPKNERDFYLVLVADLNGDGQIDERDIHALMGLPQWALAHVITMIDPALQVEFAQAVLLNLVAALLQ